MWVCAYIWIGLGIGAFREVPAVRPGVFHLAISSDVRGWFWLSTAIVAVVTGLSRRGSPIGLGLLFLMPALTVASYTSSWVRYEIPGGSPGYANGWYSSYLYLGLMAWVVITALIPSRPPTTTPPASRSRP